MCYVCHCCFWYSCQWALAQMAPFPLVKARWRARLWVQDPLNECVNKILILTLSVVPNVLGSNPTSPTIYLSNKTLIQMMYTRSNTSNSTSKIWTTAFSHSCSALEIKIKPPREQKKKVANHWTLAQVIKGGGRS